MVSFGNKCKSEALNHYLYYKSPIIKNNHVLFIQTLFDRLGYPLEKDSMFGLDCKAKVLAFQNDYNLVIDGCVGSEVTGRLLLLNK